MAGQKTIEVEVVFALAERQELVDLVIASGATVAEAIDQSGIAKRFPEQDLSACTLGIWGRLADSDHVLQGGDRVEIYRPLNIDPRETRRKLAAEGKSMGHSDRDADRD